MVRSLHRARSRTAVGAGLPLHRRDVTYGVGRTNYGPRGVHGWGRPVAVPANDFPPIPVELPSVSLSDRLRFAFRQRVQRSVLRYIVILRKRPRKGGRNERPQH